MGYRKFQNIQQLGGTRIRNVIGKLCRNQRGKYEMLNKNKIKILELMKNCIYVEYINKVEKIKQGK